MRISTRAMCLLWLSCAVFPADSRASDADFFESKIRPILVARCYGCHSAEKNKTQGGLALDSRQGWQRGGDTGPALVPGNADESLLIQAIRYADDGPQMPPASGGGKLPDAEIALLVEWVRRGAFDPRDGTPPANASMQAARSWWSFQPLAATTPPTVPAEATIHNDIDRFLLARLEAAQLQLSPPADRRTLIRRVTYDLLGLPPTPEEVEAFESDTAADAYEALIERLLASPHYGERWGRHWLDLVRYADTAGENTDHPIPDAWRYRNWVIEAFRQDLPYDRFVREQIAGDLLHTDEEGRRYADGVIATGFLAIARRFDHDSDKHMHLTYEDAIDVVGRAFLGLSIACARCHDHKYDPISARDYYALYGILQSTRFAFPGCEAKQQPRDMVSLLTAAEWARTIEPYDRELAAIDDRLKKLEEAAMQSAGTLAAAAKSSAQLLAQGEIAEGGSHDVPTGGELESMEVQLGNMLQLTIDPAGNYGADTTLIEWQVEEIGGEQRQWNLTRDVIGDFLAGNPHADSLGNPSTWLFLDARGGLSLLPELVRDHSKPGLHVWRKGDNPSVFANTTDQPIAVWTTLPPQSLFVHPAADGPVALGWVSPMAGRVRIRARIADAHPGGPNGVAWKLELRQGDLRESLRELSAVATERRRLAAERQELETSAPMREVAYAVTEGECGHARLHLRGDPERLGEEVPRRWLEIFGGERIPEGGGSGRRQLANWLTDPANPLAARVMVNRIWQHHFGHGLVRTPNDFGTRGQPPRHPELLDWLAKRFIESGWSIKAMHRLILTSAAYRQSSGESSSEDSLALALAADPNNELYWRFDRRRMSAEELRDSLLSVSGKLDPTPGSSFPIPPASGWSYTQHVPFAGVPETDKRSVYQMTLRNRRPPFMSLFDGPDPNATTAVRQVTTVPTQALYFLNDPFFHAQAAAVARRIISETDDTRRLHALYRLVLQRRPTDEELAMAMMFLERYVGQSDSTDSERALDAWSAYARVLLASNEFLYLD